ncbi:MAG: IS630 family transposase [Pseudomonadota bacterium]
MPRAYSDDLRERVVAAMRAGQSCRAVGARFGIAPSTAPSTGVKWVGRVARTGSVRAGKMGGHRRPILEPHRDWLLSEVRACPEITLAMLRELLAGRGVAVSQDTVWRFLKACGFRFKKTLVADERDRADVRRRRERWQRHQHRIDPRRLVFVDETWIKTNMAPLRGWSAKGERLPGAAPFGHWRTATFIGALRHDRVEAPWVIEGPVNGEVFRTYVEKILAPTLRPGDIVVMDNLGSHKSQTVRREIRAVGAHLLFLPPYSPDHSTRFRGPTGATVASHPSEQAFAKLKHWLRKAAPRSRDSLWRSAGAVLDRFAPDECTNYFANAGYAST